MARTSVQKEPGSLFEVLTSKSFAPEQTLASRNALSVKENRSIYRCELSSSRPTAVFSIDGYIITSGLRCDKLLLVDLVSTPSAWNVVFIELKGSNVHHAIEQIKCTLENKLFVHETNKGIFARVVGLSFPSNKSDVSLEKAKIEFRKKYNCELKKLKSGQPDVGIS